MVCLTHNQSTSLQLPANSPQGWYDLLITNPHLSSLQLLLHKDGMFNSLPIHIPPNFSHFSTRMVCLTHNQPTSLQFAAILYKDDMFNSLPIHIPPICSYFSTKMICLTHDQSTSFQSAATSLQGWYV